MKTTIIIWFVWSLFHGLLLKWLPYRWLVNSALYPIKLWLLKRELLLMNEKELVDMWYDWHHKWFFKYWFGQKLLKVIEDRILELDNRKKYYKTF